MKVLPALLSQTTLILANFNFRMASNKSLNATCNLDRYLFCKMPAGALEVEVKVKTTWGKFSMVQDIHTRTEKYCAWEKADGRSNIKTRKRKASHKVTNMQTEDNTSETDVPAGQRVWVSPSGLHRSHICSSNTPHGGRRRSRTGKEIPGQIL